MRRYSLTLLALILALAMGAAACDSGAKLSTSQPPEQMLTAAWNAHHDATSQAGTYEVALTIEADAAQLPQDQQGMMQALLASPIMVSGDFAIKDKPLSADISLNASLMGTTMAAGAKVLKDKVWMNVLGQWYEAPAETGQQLAAVDTNDMVDDLLKTMDELEVDPAAWCTDLTVVGEETVADTQVIHVRGTPDMEKMVTDVVALMQSEQMVALLGAAVPAGGSTDSAPNIPTPAEIQEMMADYDQILEDATLDFWLSKADATIRKMTVNAQIAVPRDLGITGLSGFTVAATINLQAINGAVNVLAPTSALPFTNLMQNIMQNPLLQGIIQSISGSGL